jgi:hypothetical protein
LIGLDANPLEGSFDRSIGTAPAGIPELLSNPVKGMAGQP